MSIRLQKGFQDESLPLALSADFLINSVLIHALQATVNYNLKSTRVWYHTSQGNFLFGKCHCSISQNTIAHENTSTLWLYLGCACHSSGACQLTVPTKLRTIDRVDCLTFANPKSAILAVPREVMRMLEDLQSLWITEG